MSFNDFSQYAFEFDRLDKKLKTKAEQKIYYDRWMNKYSNVFKNNKNKFSVMEWDLRCRKSLREIFSSATFLIEAKKNLEMKCFSSYYFSLYYSLFHSVYACIFLDTETTMSSLQKVTHKNIINIFVSAFGNTSNDLMTSDIKDTFNKLKYKREYYSYVTPFNNLFNYEHDINFLIPILLDCYQMASFHTLMIEKSYRRNKVEDNKIIDKKELVIFDDLFYNLFSNNSDEKNRVLDPSSKYMRQELLKYGFLPQYIALDLEHQFDEFHTYDTVYEKDENDFGLNVLDIWSLIYDALI